MSRSKEDIAYTIKNNGLSVTRQRILVFEQLDNKEPLSMNELYSLVQGKLDRASLYRIIEVFERQGIVKRINIGWKYKIELSDKYTYHHHHLTCINCGLVIPINETDLESFFQKLTLTHKFKPIDHQVELQGLCQTCALKQEDK